MADTYTTNLNLTKPEPGAAEDTWGISLNADLDSLDAIFSTSGTQINLNPNQINFADGKKAVFGNSSDLEIYHDGSNSWIKDAGTGDLVVRSSTNIFLQDATGANNYAKFTTNAVELRHNNDVRFTTTSSGINVTGTVTSDGLTVNGNPHISVGDTNTQYIQFGSTAIDNRIGVAAYDSIYIEVDRNNANPNSSIVHKIDNKSRLLIQDTGDISFYDDSGTSQNLKWDASADSLNFVDNAKAKFGTGSDLEIYHDGIHSYIADVGSGVLFLRGESNIVLESNSGSNYFEGTSGGASRIYFAGAEKLATTSTGINVTGTVTSDGLILDANTGLYSTDATLSNYASNNGVYLNGNIGGWLRLGADRTGQQRWDLFGNNGGGYARLLTDNKNRLNVANNGDISFYDDSGTTQGLFWDSSAESLGIGTTSPDALLEIDKGSEGEYLRVGGDNASNARSLRFTSSTASGSSVGALHTIKANSVGGEIAFANGNGNIMYLDVNRNVGIGTDSPSEKLHVIGGAFLGSTTHASDSRVTINGSVGGISNALTVKNSSASTSGRGTRINLASSNTEIGRIEARTVTDSTSGSLSLSTASSGSMSTAMFIDSSQRVGIGTTSPSAKITLADHTTAAGGIKFRSASSSVSLWSSGSGNLNTDKSFNIGSRLRLPGGNAVTDPDIGFTGASSGTGFSRAANDITFITAASERMRIDGSTGSLLVGTTSTTPAFGTGNGTAIKTGEMSHISRIGGTPLALNRASSDGAILGFNKDGSSVGSIGTVAGGLIIGNGDTGLRMQSSIDAIYAFNTSTNANRDDAIDLGAASVRFQDIYATNGTIQTSDINEKQDIEDLSEAETRVAVAAKGLLKKYRWKSAVADKGDDARIHFGIMAQDLQQAFSAEGLDAGDYGMFISSTWTDETTGEEKTRLGVRYNELLAFIIAAI